MISYKQISHSYPGFNGTESYLAPWIDRFQCKDILEVGAGANPALTAPYVRDAALNYTISDVNANELAKAGVSFNQLLLDVEHAEMAQGLSARFDCIFSKLMGEHIGDARKFHLNIRNMLRPGGISVHFFATLWALPFAVNRFLPESVSGALQQAIHPRDQHQQAKFPAKYSWSRGPTKEMVKNFEEIGFEVILYEGYFGHFYYHSKLPWLHSMEMLKSDFLSKRPVPQLCSYATVILRKPGESDA